MSDEDLRHSTRASLFLLATCRFTQRQEEHRVKLRNISATGLQAEGTVQATTGEPVTIDLRNIGPVDGIVAWVREPRFGVAFAEAIDPTQLRQTSEPAANPTDTRDYYQRGPVGVINRHPEIRPERVRPI